MKSIFEGIALLAAQLQDRGLYDTHVADLTLAGTIAAALDDTPKGELIRSSLVQQLRIIQDGLRKAISAHDAASRRTQGRRELHEIFSEN